jgi:hypothetical protein
MFDSKLHQTVYRAILDADIYYSPPPGNTSFDRFVGLPYDTRVQVNQHRKDRTRQYNEVTAATPDEFRDVLQATADIGLCLPGDVDEIATHEGQHYAAAEQIVPGHSVLGIKFYRWAHTATDDVGMPRILSIGHTFFDATLSVLEIAAVAGHPAAHLDSDIRNLNSIHIASISHLGSLLVRHNTQHPDRPLPLPLSYRPE